MSMISSSCGSVPVHSVSTIAMRRVAPTGSAARGKDSGVLTRRRMRMSGSSLGPDNMALAARWRISCMALGPIMECAIWFDPNDVERRLKTLGLTFEECVRVVNAMVAAFNGCTDNDPPTAAGWDAWRFGTRTFRDIAPSVSRW
ncbi:hypothetical protein WR25_25306 [Diploscapter pachys]|uniref:Uncharacterized protein n=1 Tax=Diploscapter pachys TaxID=2018661 RepID=A0A2A2JWX6_9BILA|nr:hypothetical protein WR25_25306 [Diploscapter pachys]